MYEPVPLNKVGDYCEGEDSNTTIPVDFNGQQTLAILDSGAGVAIATKRIWESWGKPADGGKSPRGNRRKKRSLQSWL